MSAEDLAIDVGIAVNTDEFDTFVSCVENIIDHGCGYSSEVTAQICEKCKTSDLDIAKKVLRECRWVSANTSRMRPEKLKWWQTWRSKRESRDIPRWPGRAASPERRRKHNQKRPMSPMFNKQKKKKRPMSPMFNQQKKKKRPMSPVFNKQKKKRPMSPVYDRQESPVYERRRRPDYGRGYGASRKRQRYR
tara:strand:+ start:808 stop:1380 length:573 start_codon:yes stop_codon:yes gene_type:complete